MHPKITALVHANASSSIGGLVTDPAFPKICELRLVVADCHRRRRRRHGRQASFSTSPRWRLGWCLSASTWQHWTGCVGCAWHWSHSSCARTGCCACSTEASSCSWNSGRLSWGHHHPRRWDEVEVPRPKWRWWRWCRWRRWSSSWSSWSSWPCWSCWICWSCWSRTRSSAILSQAALPIHASRCQLVEHDEGCDRHSQRIAENHRGRPNQVFGRTLSQPLRSEETHGFLTLASMHKF